MNLITRLRELDQKATKGPWTIDDAYDDFPVERTPGISSPSGAVVVTDLGYYPPMRKDAVLITELRNALPRIIALLEAAELVEKALRTITVEQDGEFFFRTENGIPMEMARYKCRAVLTALYAYREAKGE